MKKKRKYTFIKRIKNGKKATCQVGPYVIKDTGIIDKFGPLVTINYIRPTSGLYELVGISHSIDSAKNYAESKRKSI
jgi:hypothetical protein